MSNEEWQSSDTYWENRYQTGQTGWDRGETHPALVNWISTRKILPCRILVPGCGNGYEVVELARQGFQVTAIDFSPTPLERLQFELNRLQLKAELILGDLFDFDASQPFEAVYEQTCLCALAPSERVGYESKIYDLLQPSGDFYVLFMQTPNKKQGPPFHCELDEMRQLFCSDRWSWNDHELIGYEHPAGSIHELATRLKRI